MNQQDAFTAEPPTITFDGDPIQLRRVNPGFRHVVDLVEKLTPKKGTDEERAKAIGRGCVLAYAAIYSLTPSEAAKTVLDEKAFEQAVMEADMALSSEDVSKCDEYLSGVFERAQASAVEVEKPGPGKPRETRQTQRRRR